jgi:2-polyprenyl-3-methyl-5-hydroxy-6-metoxy-1,4-benzoquinol methylase
LSDELHAEHREGRGNVEAEWFWEDHYHRRERVWSGRPNPALVDVVGSLRPGTALDLGCGEGGDAIWLARQGWRRIYHPGRWDGIMSGMRFHDAFREPVV